MSGIEAMPSAAGPDHPHDTWVRSTPALPEPGHSLWPAPVTGLALTGVWQSVDGTRVRAYGSGRPRSNPDHAWQRLQLLQVIDGPAAGVAAPFHYVVETDVLPQNDAALNDWYAQEHLPGLAAVPGTVRAARYVRLNGSPKYYACYDLMALEVLESEPWLAVRHTAWSSRVRPMFRNTLRTRFRRMDLALAPVAGT